MKYKADKMPIKTKHTIYHSALSKTIQFVSNVYQIRRVKNIEIMFKIGFT
jgi:hypothetical protein